MKKRITENLALKIISLMLGVLVWLIVANINDPIISRGFTIQNVELINEAYIDNTGKVCLRDGDRTPVRVTLTGNSSVLSRLSADDIRVVADLQQAVSLDTDPVMIPLSASCSRIPSSNISVSPQNFSVTLEDKVTNEFLVTVTSGDSKPGKGYEIGSQTAYPEKVQVTGPKSLMKKLDKVIAAVNVGGITEDKTETASLRVVDKNADTLSETAMSNLRIGNEGKVTVTTRLWRIRTDVGLNAEYSGNPAEGFCVNKITTVPETISVAGTTDALENLRLDGNVLWIPEESIDIEGQKQDVEVKVNISQYLPAGLKLTTGSSDEVIVTVRILPDGSDIYTISTSSVRVDNKAEEFQAAFGVDKIELRIRAEDGDLSDFHIEDCIASIDLEDKEEGTFEVPVNISLPEGYALIGKPFTEITISRVSTIEEGD
ncbi:MAG: hypothetical protein IIY55_02055 [Blautia sp.]|nr:hypothetical protein [Blautia sp.]